MTPAAEATFAQAVDEYLGWYGDVMASLDAALAADPGLLLGYTTKAALYALGGVKGDDPLIQTALRAARALATSATPHETYHLRAAEAWAAGRMSDAAEAWELALSYDVHDLLALHLAHDTHFFLGRADKLRDVPLAILPAQPEQSRARGYVLGMAAFGLEECGEYAAAEDAGREAIALNPDDSWAAHAVAHVLEMQDRPAEGIAWLRGLEPHWARAPILAVHQYWHLALFLIEDDRADEVLALYDAHIAPGETAQILDLVDAAALLWRLELLGIKPGPRWRQLAPLWARYALDHVLTFNDVHIAFTLEAAGDTARRAEQAESLAAYAQGTSENARLTREIGLPLIAGMSAWRAGAFAETVARIAPLRHRLHEIGGSHAQRDLFIQTLIQAALRAGLHDEARLFLTEREAQKTGIPRACLPYLAN